MKNNKRFIKHFIIVVSILLPISILIAVKITKPVGTSQPVLKVDSIHSERPTEAIQSSASTETKASVAPAASKLDMPNFKSYFNEYKGAAFLIENEDGVCLGEYNHEFLDRRISPYSTFKILNSLIFINEGLVENQSSVIKWDNTRYQIESWNSDQTLRSAFENSVVWVYHKLSKKVSREKYKEYLTKAYYGNCDVKTDQTDFWLNSSLKISMKEQVDFLRNFHNGKLGFPDKATAVVKDIMKCYETDAYTVYGKTGTGQGTNLFVGYVEDHNKNVFYFATYLYNEGSKNEAKPVTYKIISDIFTGQNKPAS